MKQDHSEENQSKGIKVPTFILSIIIVALLSVGATLFVTNGQGDQEGTTEDTSTSQPVSGEKTGELASVNEVYQLLQQRYFEEIEPEVLIQGAISGMADAVGDPYTEFLDEVESSSLNEDISGSFEGIGAEVMKEGEGVRIVSPIADSPAEKAGLMPNDIILSVDGESVAELSLTEAVEKIRGPKGTEVVLSVARGDNIFEVKVTRDSIPLETVRYQLDEEDPTIGYVQITNFSMPTYDELVEAVEELKGNGAESFIFDVRGNPGGLLSSAIQLSNVFVDEGDVLLRVEQRGEEPFIYTADNEMYGEYKVTDPSVLLIDGGSASASEILAGAMNQSAGIPLYGMPTFGKGTIQNIQLLQSAGELKLTIGKWLTPEGTWVHEDGLQPTEKVELPEYVNLLIIDATKTYKENDVSAEVENLEEILDALDYSPGKVDGLYDQETVAAVKAFQQANDIEADGQVTGRTATSLVDALRALIEENDTQYKAAKKHLQNK